MAGLGTDICDLKPYWLLLGVLEPLRQCPARLLPRCKSWQFVQIMVGYNIRALEQEGCLDRCSELPQTLQPTLQFYANAPALQSFLRPGSSRQIYLALRVSDNEVEALLMLGV